MLQVNNSFAHGDIACLKHEMLRRDGTRTRVVCCGKRCFDSAWKAFRSKILIFRPTDGDLTGDETA